MMDCSVKINQEIFRDLVSFYGETFRLSPLAAKIYAYLIFDFKREGISFDEFVKVFAASKSSVSSSINILLNAKLITDFTPMSERKRLFIINEDYFKLRFEAIVSRMKQETQILNKLQDFRRNCDDNSQEKFEIYISLLNKNIDNIQQTLTKISK